jgi:hypothetical protein
MKIICGGLSQSSYRKPLLKNTAMREVKLRPTHTVPTLLLGLTFVKTVCSVWHLPDSASCAKCMTCLVDAPAGVWASITGSLSC